MTGYHAGIAVLLAWCSLACPPVLAATNDDTGRDTNSVGGGPGFRSQSDVLAWRSAWRRGLAPGRLIGDSWRVEYDREVSISLWKAHVSDQANRSGGSDQTFIGATSRGVRLYARPRFDGRIRPFVEAGIGLAWFQHKDLASEDVHEGALGSHLLFEDRLEAGLRFPGLHGLELKAMLVHYSNANLGDRNDGENLRMLTIALPF